MTTHRTIRRTRSLGLFGILMIGMIGSAPLSAQWEQTFGGNNCDEVAHKGIAQVKVSGGGGYIFAGQSRSTGAPCGVTNIYVARISDNPGGLPLWANTYRIGGPGSSCAARCVAECANGDFIVTGVTDNLGGCHQNDLFLMRLTSGGSVIWAKTYGTANPEAGSYVFEAKTGNAATAHPGDIVACGYATDAAGLEHGYIIRTTSTGVLQWDQTYTGPVAVPGNRRFNAITEETWAVGGTGDLIAVGYVVSPAMAQQGLVTRVDGTNGAIGAAPQNAAFFGGAANERLNDVQEMHVAGNAGNIIATGASGNEIYLIKLTADPCMAAIGDATIGDGAAGTHDESFCVRELPGGNLIIAGISELAGFGGTDAFLAEVGPVMLMPLMSPPTIGFKVYGGTNNDGAHGCAPVAAGAGGINPAQGYIVGGFTQSSPPMVAGDVGQAYVVKTDMLGATSCEGTRALVTGAPGFAMNCFVPVQAAITSVCPSPPCVKTPLTTHTSRCIVGSINRGDDNGGNDGIAGAAPESTPHPLDETSVSSYPNPLAKGEAITFNYHLTKSADVSITVSDIAGAIIARKIVHCETGMNLIPVSTDGWASGTYMVTLGANGRSVSQQVIVTER